MCFPKLDIFTKSVLEHGSGNRLGAKKVIWKEKQNKVPVNEVAFLPLPSGNVRAQLSTANFETLFFSPIKIRKTFHFITTVYRNTVYRFK